jgi:hypothetical protein
MNKTMLKSYYQRKQTEPVANIAEDFTIDPGNYSNDEFIDTGISVEGLASAVNQPPEEDEFYIYLTTYVNEITILLEQIQHIKYAEKALKRRLKFASQLQIKLIEDYYEDAPIAEQIVEPEPEPELTRPTRRVKKVDVDKAAEVLSELNTIAKNVANMKDFE